MICSVCNKSASDNPVAYYQVTPAPEQRPNWQVWKCWFCLSSTEKLEREGIMKVMRRFTMGKTITSYD